MSLKRLAENMVRERKRFTGELVAEVLKMHGFLPIPRIEWRSPGATHGQYSPPRRALELAPAHFRDLRKWLEAENVREVEWNVTLIVGSIAHEVAHFMHHGAAGWDREKAFPKAEIVRRHCDRPFEKYAKSVEEEVLREFFHAVAGFPTRLSPFVQRWSG